MLMTSQAKSQLKSADQKTRNYYNDNKLTVDLISALIRFSDSPKLTSESLNGYGQAVGYKRTLGCLVDASPKPNYEYEATQLMWVRGNAAVNIDGSRQVLLKLIKLEKY